MKKITKYMLLCLIVFAFGACYEDKGHYDHIYSNIEKLNYYSKQNVSTAVSYTHLTLPTTPYV